MNTIDRLIQENRMLHERNYALSMTLKQVLEAQHTAPKASTQRPPNCGTGYCSCVECLVEEAKE
jgi:hypothetical protein